MGCAPQASPVPQDAPAPTETATESPELDSASEGVTGAATFKVIKIVDGDTIDVLTVDQETIRLESAPRLACNQLLNIACL